MIIRGRVWTFGSDIDTDAIIPARYLTTSEPQELALHCMEDADPLFAQKVESGDIIVARKNFGCGSSREHAPLAIKGAGVSCVIADSFARIFYRNAINIGLPILECPEVAAFLREGDLISVNLEEGVIIVAGETGEGSSFKATPFPPFMRELIKKGGLINYVRERIT